jgi:PAS domain S-box-containing protein
MEPNYDELRDEATRLRQELQVATDILDTILDPVFVKDANFVYTNCNLAFANYLGLPKDKIINSTVFDIASKDLAGIYYDADCKLKEKKEIQVYEHQVMYADGTLHDVIFHKAPIMRNSEFCGITGIMFDVTEKKKSEQLIMDYVQSLKMSNLEKDKFISIIAHELKNPFNAIIGFSRFLLKNLKDADMVKALKHATYIDEVANQAYKLLQNLLLWANSSRGKLTYEPRKIGLMEIVDSNFNLLKNLAMKKNIALTNNIAKDYAVLGDKNMINSLLQNLITNAIKYTPNDGHIGLSAENENEFIKITIKDNGIGISEDIKDSLFKLDVNPSTRGTAGEHGTGLGLLLCKEFVEKHGGRIWVESGIGNGSEFIFTLPKAI